MTPGRFAGGRDAARTPAADPRARRADQLKAQAENLGDGLTYDASGRLTLAEDVRAKLAAIPGVAAPSAMALATNNMGGAADGILDALPSAGAAYSQSAENAFRASVRDNLNELQLEVETMRKALANAGVVR